MEIRHLRYFVAMAESSSILHASERLHVAQSSLSVHLANLESDLGLKLMERNRKGVTLTPAGQMFYEQAQNLLRQYQEMRENVRGLAGTARGRVSIGMPSTTSAVIAGDLYRMIAEEYPEISVYITDAGAGNVYEWLLDGRLDLAIIFSVPDSTDLVVTPLHDEEFWLVSHPRSAPPGEIVDFADIFALPLVTSSRATTWRKVIDDVAGRFDKSINPIIETESVAALQSILMSGQASAVLPKSYIERQLHNSDLKCQRLVNPDLRGIVSLVHLSAAPLGAAQKAVKKMLITALRRPECDFSPRQGQTIPVMRSVPTVTAPPGVRRKRRKDTSPDL